MSSEILVSAARLDELISAGSTVVVDCRFALTDPDKGRSDWLAGHIPGAAYAHLDDDLSAPVQDHTGRHPLPDTDTFARFLAANGWSAGKLLVAYDDGSNAMAARLWWLMKYYSQPAALLDGGMAAWIEEGLPVESGATSVEAAAVEQLVPNTGLTASADFINERLDSEAELVVDARGAERYSGEVEPLDTRAGHIPGSVNRPFTENLDAGGKFRDPEELRPDFEKLLEGRGADSVIHSCGSGVTACHNLFAMELAGLGTSLLYPGSWSHWIRDPDRPIVSGGTP